MQCREVAVSISRRRHERREEDEVDERSSSRVVAPQKPDDRPSPEQMNTKMTWFWRPALPIPVLAGTRMGKPWMQQKEWMCLCVGLIETNVETSLSIYLAARQAKGRMSQPQKGRRHHGREELG